MVIGSARCVERKVGALCGLSAQESGSTAPNIPNILDNAPAFIPPAIHTRKQYQLLSAQQSACQLSPHVFEVTPHHAEQADRIGGSFGILTMGREIVQWLQQLLRLKMKTRHSACVGRSTMELHMTREGGRRVQGQTLRTSLFCFFPHLDHDCAAIRVQGGRRVGGVSRCALC